MTSFSTLGLSQPLLTAVEALGFSTPTPIQSQAVPRLLQGDTDFVGLAQTGTGKTAAFGLPLLQLIDAEVHFTQALVLAPTRELCLQITRDLEHFGKYLPQVRIAAVYGGADILRQMREIRAGAQVIVATPGRLRDLIRRQAVRLDTIRTVVLDEADEMLNMGFKEEIDDILQHTPEDKHTWLFSATMPPDVRRIARDYMSNPFELKTHEGNSVNDDIEHQYVLVHPADRYPVLRRFLDFDPDTYALVFCRTKKETQEVADQLTQDGYLADALHGDLSQAQRDQVMARFRVRKLQVLVATDVAARGIDVDELTHVFHYRVPDDLAYYTHRSGRTGRAGNKGISLVFTHPKEMRQIKFMERQLKLSFSEAHVPTGEEICQQQLLAHMHKLKEIHVNGEMNPYLPALMEELSDLSKEELIKRVAALSFGDILKTYGNAPDLNRNSRQKGHAVQGKTQRLFISIGRLDLDGKGDFLSLICDHAGISGDAIGKIDMRKTHSFFEVEESVAGKVVNTFRDSYLNDRPIRIHNEKEDTVIRGPKNKFEKKGKKKFKKAFAR